MIETTLIISAFARPFRLIFRTSINEATTGAAAATTNEQALAPGVHVTKLFFLSAYEEAE
jgi:hypothetical protein